MRSGSCGCGGSGGACACPSSGALQVASPGMTPAGALWVPEGAFEPFPRQTLVGVPSGPPWALYYSAVYDATRWKSLAYWFQVFYAYPAGVTGQAVAYIQTSADPTFAAWEEMVPGGIDTQAPGPPEMGVVDNPAEFVRICVELPLVNEIASLAFALVSRRA